MKRDVKLAIIAGILVTLIWYCYINVIYMDSTEESMDKRERCVEPMNAQTKVCPPSGYYPKTYTNFGWMG